MSTLPSRLNDYVLDPSVTHAVGRIEEAEAVELLLVQEDEPVTFNEAVKEKVWREAMNKEIQAIVRNKTWILTEPPPKCRPIGLKWVYKKKKDDVGNVTKHKARLVAKGYV